MSAPAETPTRIGAFADLETEEPFPGVRRQAITTARVTTSRYTFEPGASFPLHSHPQEQMTLVERGAVEMTIAGSSTRLGAGDWSVVGPGVEHGITAGDDGARILAIVAPARRSSDEYEIAEGGAGP